MPERRDGCHQCGEDVTDDAACRSWRHLDEMISNDRYSNIHYGELLALGAIFALIKSLQFCFDGRTTLNFSLHPVFALKFSVQR